jgi:alpha/beta superfamily hydrolase
MNAQTQRELIAGPAGRIECAVDLPAQAPRGLAVAAHPHPLYGGTLDNKVVQTLARAFVQCGFMTVRPNFRGVGATDGTHDEGRGEADDLLAVVRHYRAQRPGPLLLGGFSFGAAVASLAAQRLQPAAARLVLVGASVRSGLAAVPAGTVVIHGEQDDVVPLAQLLDWARPQSLPVIVVPGAGHFFHGQLPLLKQLMLRNLSDLNDDDV